MPTNVDHGWKPFGGGTFTCEGSGDGSSSVTITDSGVTSNCQVLVTPTNAAAGLLLQTKTCYVTAVANGSFHFDVSATAAGTGPLGTETFSYIYLDTTR